MFLENLTSGIDENAMKEMISYKNRCCANEVQLLSAHKRSWNLLLCEKYEKCNLFCINDLDLLRLVYLKATHRGDRD